MSRNRLNDIRPAAQSAYPESGDFRTGSPINGAYANRGPEGQQYGAGAYQNNTTAGATAGNPYARSGQAGAAAPQAYEMQTMPTQPVESMNDFYQRIGEVRTAIEQFNSNIDHIEGLHARSLTEIGDEQSAWNHRELEKASTETRILQNNIRDAIKKLEHTTSSMQAGPDNKSRVLQTNQTKKKMLETIKRFQRVEVEYKNKYRAQQRRQVEITNPNLTSEEIESIVDSDQGQQIFAEATMKTNRHGEARSALREVQERHQDIKKIEKTIAELAELFADMNVMMQEQAPMVETIAEQAQATKTDVQEGNKHIDKAVVSARAARKKKWICFWIVVVIIVAVALGVGLGIASSKGKL
ncbi:t-SNARE [Protomyces lactucae-debilis]|uniref:t-SNARE n=1 Tax=Protomyces lactucae-debilis TaxID=2754530 RepID=A0A1Y2FC80_PROLT|nr:t-SNARE [Protomyces lactucae-debilis]ORY81024.1 t-SNARE [Protomyces lactucae-debilis]